MSLKRAEGRQLKLHFLPPYCSDHNRIERVWQDLHANVAGNHGRSTMKERMSDVRYNLRRKNRKAQNVLAT